MSKLIRNEIGDWGDYFLILISGFIGGGWVYILSLLNDDYWPPASAAIVGGFMAIIAYRFLVVLYINKSKIKKEDVKGIIWGLIVIIFVLWTVLSSWTWTKGALIVLFLFCVGLWDTFKETREKNKK